MKEKAKDEIRKEAIAKAIEFGMHFRGSTLFLIKKKHSRFDLAGINFINMQGHNVFNTNNRSIVVPADEANDDKWDDSTTLEDAEDAFSADLKSIYHLPHCNW